MNVNFKEVKNSLAKKLLINFLIICTIAGAIMTALYYCHAKLHIWKLFSRVATSCAVSGANMFHNAPINDFLNGHKLELYQNYQNEMKHITEAFNLRYFYVYIPDLENDKLIPIIGVDGNTGKSIENFKLGEPLNLKLNPDVVDMFVNNKKTLAIEMNNEFGHVFTGYSVVTDKNNKPIAIIGADIDYQHIMYKLIKDCSLIFVFIFFVLMIMYFAGIFYIQKTFIKPILSLSTNLSSYLNQENIESKSSPIALSTDDELNVIADLCNGMALEKKRIENELNIARKIQLSALQMVFPPFPNSKEFDVFANLTSSKEVGGDFYDFFYVAADRFVFLVADVCGKGIPAALFMMQTKALLANTLQTGMSLEYAINRVNRQICENNNENYFITAFFASVNLFTGQVEFINAGHNPPLIKRANGEFEYIETERNIVLGIMDDHEYQKTVTKFDKGDMIFLYTDGVTEALNPNEELFGVERLRNSLNNSKSNELQEIVASVREDISDFVNDAEQSDDITTLIFKYKGIE